MGGGRRRIRCDRCGRPARRLYVWATKTVQATKKRYWKPVGYWCPFCGHVKIEEEPKYPEFSDQNAIEPEIRLPEAEIIKSIREIKSKVQELKARLETGADRAVEDAARGAEEFEEVAHSPEEILDLSKIEELIAKLEASPSKNGSGKAEFRVFAFL